MRTSHLNLIVCLTYAVGSTCALAWAQTPPAPAADAAAAPEPATIDGCQVVARIDGQVVLACEVLWKVNHMLEDNRDKIPPDQFQAVRDHLMQRTLAGVIDQKLLYGEFRRNIPPENMPRIEENLLKPFDEMEAPRLMKQLEVNSQRDLEKRLSELGSSMADVRRNFNEQVIAHEWIKSKIRVSEEVGPEEMVEYYRTNRAEFEYPTQARWEELTVRKGETPESARQAFAKLATMGNEVFPRLAAGPPPATPVFADVARAKSESFNAKDGGVHDWTTKGALKALVIDEALFNLPVGQMSPILDSGTAFHIVRVLERKDAGCRPFSEVQNDIRERLKDQRLEAAQAKYLAELRRNAKIWTIYTGNITAEALMSSVQSAGQRR